MVTVDIIAGRQADHVAVHAYSLGSPVVRRSQRRLLPRVSSPASHQGASAARHIRSEKATSPTDRPLVIRDKQWPSDGRLRYQSVTPEGSGVHRENDGAGERTTRMSKHDYYLCEAPIQSSPTKSKIGARLLQHRCLRLLKYMSMTTTTPTPANMTDHCGFLQPKTQIQIKCVNYLWFKKKKNYTVKRF